LFRASNALAPRLSAIEISVMKFPFSFLAATIAFVAPQIHGADARPEPPTEWIDPDTGHRIVRLSTEPGSASLYFNQNAYTPDGKKVLITTPTGLSTIDLATHQIEQIVAGEVRVIMAGHKTGDVYFLKRVPAEASSADGTKSSASEAWVYAANVETKTVRQIARLPRGGIASINADETLMVGVYTEGQTDLGFGGGDGRGGRASPTPADAPPPAAGQPSMSNTSASQPNNGGANPTFQAHYSAKRPDGTPMTFAEAKDFSLHTRLLAIRQGPPQVIFTLNIATGEIKEVLKEREWIGHVQFSPTDPQQIMFCHEGTWHEVDRVWLIRTDGTGLTKVHTRMMNMEIAGHEFFNADGRTIWYDLQTPRGEDFWLAGYEIGSRKRTWYHLQRDEWSVHFNISPDGKLFCGDGGDSEMVARATNGKWIYLFRPERIPDVAGIKNPSGESLISPGVFKSERLVNMSRHDYTLEPNVSFTPDMKWIVFRSNMHGATQVYAVEVAKAK
jgi:oligogalacturonide lyase